MKHWFNVEKIENNSISLRIGKGRYFTEVMVNWAFISVILFISNEVGIFSQLFSNPTAGSIVVSMIISFLVIALFFHSMPSLKTCVFGADYLFEGQKQQLLKNDILLFNFEDFTAISVIPFKQKSRDWALFLSTKESGEFFLCRDADKEFVDSAAQQIAESLSLDFTPVKT